MLQMQSGLGSVLTDLLGVSGRSMLSAMLEGTKRPEEMADMAKGRMRQKLPELRCFASPAPFHAFFDDKGLFLVSDTEHVLRVRRSFSPDF